MHAMHEQDQRERGSRDGGVVGGDHPRHSCDRGVELCIELRQREHDDRGVGECDCYGGGNEQRDDTVRLGTGLDRSTAVLPGKTRAAVLGFARDRHRPSLAG
jgi:hypothetical protein